MDLLKVKYILSYYSLGLGTHLFVKVRRPGDSEGTFVTTSLTTQR